MNRRRFFHWCSLSLTGLSAAFMAIPGVGFLLAPLGEAGKPSRRRHRFKVADLEPGVPRKMVLVDQRVDAWTRYPEGPIGTIWLVRRDDDSVDAFSAICPHLGCPVDYMPSEESCHYYCPCHEANFSGKGEVLAGPSPRGLDSLKVSSETVDGEQWISVVFEKFETGTPEKNSLG